MNNLTKKLIISNKQIYLEQDVFIPSLGPKLNKSIKLRQTSASFIKKPKRLRELNVDLTQNLSMEFQSYSSSSSQAY